METAVALLTTAAMLAASHAVAAEAQKPQRLYWPHLALSKDRGERIDSFEIQVTCGEFRGVSNIPKDWSLEVVSPSSGITHLRASAGHGAAMIWSLRKMEGSISIGAIDPSCFDISAQVVVDSSGQEKKYKFSRSELRLRP
ncbi:MAG TPA: hypothetical protein VN782_10200 [Usitatibacter sp.]|nr:hypothetical protein [Usitatibacter sp.]